MCLNLFYFSLDLSGPSPQGGFSHGALVSLFPKGLVTFCLPISRGWFRFSGGETGDGGIFLFGKAAFLSAKDS